MGFNEKFGCKYYMITEAQFEELIKNVESTTLDFKREQYKFNNDSAYKTDEFVKDIICFSNTIRDEAAYIIIGISIENGKKGLLGINTDIDDAIFQQKIKDKVYPKPTFLYYTFDYKGNEFGIIEIPVTKYQEPITPIIKMKGLEPGRVYFRRGSSNSEAIGKEIIYINKWLESLPSLYESTSLLDDISHLLSLATSKDSMLSNTISEGLRIAKKHNLESLIRFCTGELTGWNKRCDEDKSDYLKYRMSNFVISPPQMELQIPHYISYNSTQLYNELKGLDSFYEQKIVFTESIIEIENSIKKMEESNGNMLYIKQVGVKTIFENGKMGSDTIKIYAIKNNFDIIYGSIKQRYINELMSV